MYVCMYVCVLFCSACSQKRELSSGKDLPKEEVEKREKQKQEELRRELQKVKLRRLVRNVVCGCNSCTYTCICDVHTWCTCMCMYVLQCCDKVFLCRREKKKGRLERRKW